MFRFSIFNTFILLNLNVYIVKVLIFITNFCVYIFTLVSKDGKLNPKIAYRVKKVNLLYIYLNHLSWKI